jgi:hypothetical protein
MDREQLITDMCLTFRHDYGLRISEDERMYSLNSGMTELERQGLFSTMSQVFEHHFATPLEEYRMVNEGEAITIPKSVEHAKAMMGVAQWYLDNQ